MNGLIFGIANDRSIAAAIARELCQAGARMGFTHLPDADPERPKNANRLQKVVGEWNPAFCEPCDVTQSEHLDRVFARAQETLGTLDFVLHSIAYAPLDDLKGPVHAVSRAGFLQAMEISVYSLVDIAHRSLPLMPAGGSLLTLTYYGGEKAVPGYNLMGLCKAALENAVMYLAGELGPQKIRVNALSAGPLKTLAASAVGEFDQMQKLYETFSPLRRNITPEEVGKAGAFLLSPASSGITGENLHVDGGYHSVGGPPVP